MKKAKAILLSIMLCASAGASAEGRADGLPTPECENASAYMSETYKCYVINGLRVYVDKQRHVEQVSEDDIRAAIKNVYCHHARWSLWL